MKRIMILAALALASVPAAAQWTLCASEGQVCNFTGTKLVKFGTATQYVGRTLTGPVPCTRATFGGDPAWGAVKSCWHAPSPVSASIQATRVSGVAPLAVLFDASSSTAPGVTDPFHKLTYSFNFGDERGQSWAVSGLPKNQQTGGPLAAHVFELPGTYTVRVRVQKADGTYADATTSVQVQDPATVYPGTSTVCVSQTDYTGCPAGAELTTVVPRYFAGKRVLLKRGQVFGAIQPQLNDANFQIGAFGTGAKPVVGGFSTGSRGEIASWTSDFTLMDLDLGQLNFEGSVSRATILRNDIKRPSESSEAMVNVGSITGWYHDNAQPAVAAAMYWPREVFVVENDILGKVDASAHPNATVMGVFRNSALLGNTADRATEHTLRVFSAQKFFIAHNTFGGNHYAPNGIGIRAPIKIHAEGVGVWTANVAGGRRPATSQVLLANNRIGSPTFPGSILSGFSPQTNTVGTPTTPGTLEGLEDCIAENNVFIRGPYTTIDMDLRGRRLTTRGSQVLGGDPPNISVNPSVFSEPEMANWHSPYWIGP